MRRRKPGEDKVPTLRLDVRIGHFRGPQEGTSMGFHRRRVRSWPTSLRQPDTLPFLQFEGGFPFSQNSKSSQ